MFSLLLPTGRTNALKINIHIVTDKIAGHVSADMSIGMS